MAARDKLNDTRCRAARAKERAYKLADGLGMYLWVSTTGARVWRLSYRLAGRAQTMSLGAYPDVSLAGARGKRDAARTALREGGDPMATRRATRSGVTLRQASETYWAGRGDLSASYRANALRGIEMHALPTLGERNVGGITRDDLMQMLGVMDARGLHVYVRRVRMWLAQVFEWAMEHGHAKINPTALIRPDRAFGRRPVKHFASVPLASVGALLQRLALEAELQSVLACRMLALTWTRTTELRMMLWSEIEGDVWRIPAGRMKRRREHLVPLPAQAVALLDTLRQRARGSVYVFPSEHRLDRPMSENAVLYLLARTGYKGKMTGHGWRTVGSTWANERGYNSDAIERQLAHAPDDKVRSVYNHAEYLPVRARMLQEWADWLDLVERGAI